MDYKHFSKSKRYCNNWGQQCWGSDIKKDLFPYFVKYSPDNIKKETKYL